MPIKFVTRGDPGEAILWPLRNQVNRNMNVRRLLDEQPGADGAPRRGTITGVIGGAPPARGVVVTPPPEVPLVVVPPLVVQPPIVVPPPIVLPPVVAPGSVQAWPWAPAIQPVSFTFRVVGAQIDAFASPSLNGPLFVHSVAIFYPFAEIDMNTTDILLRVDISDNATLDVFGFAGGSYPTGVSTGRETLFRYSADSGEHLLPGQRVGWMWYQPTQASDHNPDVIPVNRYVDVSPAFLKVYVQQEDVTDRTIRVIVFVSEGADQAGQAPAVSAIEPRITVQQMTRAEFRVLQNAKRPVKNA